MPVQVATSANADATATPGSTLVGIVPSDASAAVIYFDGSAGGPHLATAQSPYSTWSAQAIGAASTRSSQGLVRHTGDDNLDIIVTSPANGPFYFTAARSVNTWNLTAVGAVGDANEANNDQVAMPMWVGIDPQGRLWYVSLDDVLATWNPASADRAAGVWSVASTLEAVGLGEHTQAGITAAIIGNYLVVVYDSGAGGLKYLRLDVSQASLGAWSTAAAVTGVSDVTTASVLSLAAIPGGSKGLLARSCTSGIRALLYDAALDSWSGDTLISGATSDRHPKLIPGATGVVYLVWCQFSAANSYALVAQPFASGAWNGITTTLEAAGSNIAWPNGAYISSTQKLGLLWTQGTANPWSVQFDAVVAPSTGAPVITGSNLLMGASGGRSQMQIQPGIRGSGKTVVLG